ncbi:PREDICTED: cysteine proteinase inhibitor 1-like [Fragaria vesca subsp. vesca]|uniref:cysteine proteinase inhibitor 1-like n=1 Tax=Fragaria vesca subsp. vesca TaxID=101020 RepID=UPI0002C323C1|nr:PREDICTED: cysteine proteinase inhibitor 1-like [Fragaria vesca subsp. vesca]
MRTQCFLLALFAFLVPLVASAFRGPSEDQIVGAWEIIKDIGDPHVQEIAKWGVSEYNRQSHKGLVFQRVISGQEQSVAGWNYKLITSIKDGSSIVNYEVYVYERVWENFRQLISFTRK